MRERGRKEGKEQNLDSCCRDFVHLLFLIFLLSLSLSLFEAFIHIIAEIQSAGAFVSLHPLPFFSPRRSHCLLSAMNEVQGDQASRTRALMYSALLGSGQIPGPVSPGSVPSHLLPQYSTNIHNPYLAAANYYNQQFATNPPNFIVPTSPAAPGPYFGYPHSILSASLSNHPQSLHPPLVPHSPTSPTRGSNQAINGSLRSPSSPKELPRSDQNSAFSTSGKRKSETVSSSNVSSIMRNRLTRPPDIAIRNSDHSFLREQVPLSAPPTQTQFKEMSIQQWMAQRNVNGEISVPIATPLSAPPIPDDERGERHFNYPRFSSSFARSSDERPGHEARDFSVAAARTIRKTSSLESESMDGMVSKSDEGSPSTTASSGTPPASTTRMNEAEKLFFRYQKGNIIQLADKSLKKIEDMKTQDFLSCVASSPDLVLSSSTIVEIEMRNSISAFITFSFGKKAEKSKVEVPLDYPFFVYHQGWSSCSPDRTKKMHQLETRLLSVGDDCIILSKRVRELSVNRVCSNSKDHRNESMIAHRANAGHNFYPVNYSSGSSDQQHEEDDEYSLPMNLKKNKPTEMDVDENQNSMKQSTVNESICSNISTQ